jgi:hypothetical protein
VRGVLIHHGVSGMKWGVRKYQNADGSLTDAGRKHYGVGDPLSKTAKTATKVTESKTVIKKKQTASKVEQPKQQVTKSVKEMSESEIRDAINRMQLESQYKRLYSELNPTPTKTKSFVSKYGSKAVDSIMNELINQGSKALVKTMFQSMGITTESDKKKDKDK